VGGRSAARWHDLPERYGKWKTPHKPISRWARAKGVGAHLDDLAKGRDNQYPMPHSTLVRAHQRAATGRGKIKL